MSGAGGRRRVYGKRDSGEWIETGGVVVRLLPDDAKRGGHQRFVLDPGNGQTLLVAHNPDLAGRVPLGLGDRLRLRGVYEWNDRGGLVHWTHRDPFSGADAADGGEGGYLEYRGRRWR